MELSIIVPVYNVEKYLKKCLDSLVEQTLDNDIYEIIVVNDGSPDHSQIIIDEYVKRYKNVSSYIKTNGGLSDARNYGLDKAKGKYVAFVDSDDYVDTRMYETMLKKAEQKDFDVVVCDFVEIYSSEEVRGYSRVDQDLLCSQEVREAMVDFYPSAWNKIYKRTLFDQIRFKKGVWFEDVECLYRMFPVIETVGVVKEAFYYYIQRAGSISKSEDSRIFHYVENWNGIIDYYKEKGYLKEFEREIEYSYIRYLYATFIKASLKFNKKFYQKAVLTARQEVKKNFPYYRKNKYFYKSLKGLYCIMFNPLIAELFYMIKGKKERG